MKTLYLNHSSSPAGFRRQGFTLIEVLVVISIIVIIGSVTLYNYGNFRERTRLANDAQELKLLLRQAQTYGLGVKGQEEDFKVGYGIYLNYEEKDTYRLYHFSTEEPETSGPPPTDRRVYDENDLIQEIQLDHTTIDKVSNGEEGPAEFKWGPGNRRNWIVVFERPRPKTFVAHYGPGVVTTFSLLTNEQDKIEIILESSGGKYQQKVTVKKSGQISISTP